MAGQQGGNLAEFVANVAAHVAVVVEVPLDRLLFLLWFHAVNREKSSEAAEVLNS